MSEPSQNSRSVPQGYLREVGESITEERVFSWAIKDDRNLPDGKGW